MISKNSIFVLLTVMMFWVKIGSDLILLDVNAKEKNFKFFEGVDAEEECEEKEENKNEKESEFNILNLKISNHNVIKNKRTIHNFHYESLKRLSIIEPLLNPPNDKKRNRLEIQFESNNSWI